MRGRLAATVALALLGTVLVAATAAAQDSQAQVRAQVEDTPDALPGTYQVAVNVTVQNPQACACRETTVELRVADRPAWVDEAAFDPASYTIDWAEQTADGSPQEHVQDAALAFRVSADKAGDPAASLTLGANASSPNPAHDVETFPTQITVTFPPPADGTAGGSASADTASQEDPAERQVPVGVAVALAAGVGAAGARRGARSG